MKFYLSLLLAFFLGSVHASAQEFEALPAPDTPAAVPADTGKSGDEYPGCAGPGQRHQMASAWAGVTCGQIDDLVAAMMRDEKSWFQKLKWLWTPIYALILIAAVIVVGRFAEWRDRKYMNDNPTDYHEAGFKTALRIASGSQEKPMTPAQALQKAAVIAEKQKSTAMRTGFIRVSLAFIFVALSIILS